MIFKTFDSDLASFNSKFGIFNKSIKEIKESEYWTELKQNWSSAPNKIVAKGKALYDTGNPFKAIFGTDQKTLQQQIAEVRSQIVANPEIFNASDTVRKLREVQAQVNLRATTWDKYFETYQGGDKALREHLVNTNALVSGNAEDVTKSVKNFNASLEQQEKNLRNTSLAAKAAGTAAKVFSVALNMAITWGVTAALGLIIEGFTSIAKAEQEAAESTKRFISDFETAHKTFTNNSKELKSLNETYQELSKGVSATGENVSLTTDEYNTYKNTIDKISEIMPNLTTYFDAQGEKIGFVKGQMSDLNAEYREYIHNEATNKLGDSSDKSADDAIKNFNNQFEKEGNVFRTLKQYGDIVASNYGFNTTDYKDYFTSDQIVKRLDEYLNMSQKDFINEMAYLKSDHLRSKQGVKDPIERDIDLAKLNTIANAIGVDAGKLSDSNMSDEDYQAIREAMVAAKQNAEMQMQSATSAMISLSKEYVEGSDKYLSMTDEQLNAINNFLSNATKDTFKDVKSKTDLTKLINSIIDGTETKENQDAINDLISYSDPEKFDGTYQEWIETITEARDRLSEAIGKNPIEIEDMFGIDFSANSVADKLQNSISKIANTVGASVDDVRNKLTIEDLQIADTLEIPEGNLLSWDELLRRIEFAKREAKGGLTIDEVISSDKYKSILEEYNNIIEQLGKENSDEFASSKLRELETIMADIDNAAKAAGMSTDQFISEFSKIKDIPEPNWLSNFVRRNSSNLSNTFEDIFDGTDSEALKANKETIDNYKSSISSLQTALTSLYSGNYSTEELYEALATLQEIASLNGIEIDFSEIDLSTSEGIAELQKQAEELGTKLSDKVIKNLGISPLSSFAQGLRNIADEAINTKAKLDSFNNTVSTFQSDISSLQGALTTLYQDNYSSSELMDSLMSIKQWADNNKIDIDLSGLEDASQLSEKVEKSVDEYVNKTIKALNIDPNSNFAKLLRNVETQAVKVKAKIDGVTNSMSNLKSAYNTVSGAIEEYSEKGSLSVDTLTSLLQLEPQYLAMLIDDNGQLKLNKESFKQLALAQLNEAKAAIEARYRTRLEEIAFSDLSETTETTKNSVTDFFESVLNVLSNGDFNGVINYLDQLTGGFLGVNQAAQGATEIDLDSLYQSAHNRNARAAEDAKKEYDAGIALIGAGEKGTLNLDNYFGSGENETDTATAPHRNETNDNFYDYYSAWLEDKKQAIEKFSVENERLDNLWTKAVQNGNTEAMQSVITAQQTNTAAYSQALTKSITDAEAQTKSMLQRLYQLAPEFRGMSVEEILGNKTLQTTVEKRFDDQITANSNSQYAAEQKQDWASKANLEDSAKALNKNKSELSAIYSTLENITSDTKEWRDTLSDLPTNNLEKITAFYDEIHRQREVQRDRLAENYGTEDEQILSLLADMNDYHAQAEMLRNTLDENGNRLYSEDSQAIQDLQSAYKTAFNTIEELREQRYSRENDALSDKISTIDFKIEVIGDKDFDRSAELLAEKAHLVKTQMWNLSQEKKRLDEYFADNKDSAQYVEAMKNLNSEEKSLYDTLQDVYDKQKDLAQQRADVIKNTEDTVIEMLKDKYQTMKDEYQKRIDLEKEYIDKRKEALEKLLAMYEKKWDMEDQDSERQDKLADRAELATQRNDFGNAAASGDLTALSKMEDLDDQIRDLDKDIANDAKETYRQSVRDRIQDEIDNLDDLSAKYDLDLERFNALLDEKLKNENLYAEAHKAITTGIFEDAYGVEKSLTEAYKEYINRTADGFSWLGEETMSSFNQGLIETNKNLEDLRDILAQISELEVRDWFEALGHKVDWDNDKKEVILDDNTRISQDEFKRTADGRLIATAEQLNEIRDKYGLSNTGVVSQKDITETDTKKGLEYDKEDTLTPKKDINGITTLTTDEYLKLLGGTTFKDFTAHVSGAINSSILKDISSKLDSYVPYETQPRDVYVTNEITVQGNLDNVTLDDVTEKIQSSMKDFAEYTVKRMANTMSSFGVVGRR